VEGQVANALAEHFRNRKLYPDEKAAVQEFFQVQAACARSEGHTPRSIQEFLKTLQKTAPTGEQRADAARLLAGIR
jgi:glutathione S-transferase